VSTGRVGKNIALTMLFANTSVDTGARYTVSVFTGREHGCHFEHARRRAVSMARENTGIASSLRLVLRIAWMLRLSD